MRVFAQVYDDDVAYTLGCSPVSVYLFTFGPGRHLGGAVGQGKVTTLCRVCRRVQGAV